MFVEGSNTTDERCSIDSPSNDTVDVNVTAGTVNGVECGLSPFADGLSDPYSIQYRNSTNVVGTYRLTVFGGSIDRRDYAPDGEPSVHEFVSEATVRVTYQTPGLYYETDFGVSWRWVDG